MSFEFFINAIDLSPYLSSGYEIERGLCLIFSHVPKDTIQDLHLINRKMNSISNKLIPVIFHSANGIVSTWKPYNVTVRVEPASFYPVFAVEYKSNSGRLIMRLEQQ